MRLHPLVRSPSFLVALAALLGGVGCVEAGEAHDHDHGRRFGGGQEVDPATLPPGILRQQLQALPAADRRRALDWLKGFSFHGHDVPHLRVDRRGGVFMVCDQGLPPAEAVAQPAADTPTVALAGVPLSSVPIRHSRPGASRVILLDCNGHQVSGTRWNTSLGRDPIPAIAYDTDADPTTFSAAELTAIDAIWQRIAEDYAPFDVDVTTEEPAVMGATTARVLITRNTDAGGANNPSSSAGGVAYVNVFGRADFQSYAPAWVYANNLGGRADLIAEAGAHEAGHNLGLGHDATTTSSYYGGHGSGAVSWGPIMGTGYNRNVSQWSRGEYPNATQLQDDLAILAGKLTYRVDDHGNSSASATTLATAGGTLSGGGVIATTADVDVFRLALGAGSVSIDIDPLRMPTATRGGNLDIRAVLSDASGAVVAVDDPSTETIARIRATVAAGTYHLEISGVGAGDLTTGYSDYGSLGRFTITGTVTTGGTLPVVTIAASDGAAAEVAGGGVADPGSFTVSRSGSTSAALTVNLLVGGTASGGGDYATIAGSLVIPAGAASAPIAVSVFDDSLVEGSESVAVSVAGAAAYQVGTPGSATVAITDNDGGTGLRGEYFDDAGLTVARVTRIDPTVDFAWGSGSPDPGIGVDTFSARWTGRVQAQYGETYAFHVTGDDGVRLWIDGQLLVDRWIDQGPTEWSGSIGLAAGQQYDVRLEYYENGGGATARLAWSSPSQAKQVIPQARLYPPAPGLPAPWTTLDIGAVAAAGAASYTPDTFTVSGSGADIWNGADEFRFVRQSLTGDGEITALVGGLTNTNTWAKAGVMMRDGSGAGAVHAFMAVTPGQGRAFQYRPLANGASSNVPAGAGGAPVWVRLSRSGSVFTAWRSADGVAWTRVGSATIAMGATISVGLAVTSHADGTLCTATFSEVSVLPFGSG